MYFLPNILKGRQLVSSIVFTSDKVDKNAHRYYSGFVIALTYVGTLISSILGFVLCISIWYYQIKV